MLLSVTIDHFFMALLLGSLNLQRLEFSSGPPGAFNRQGFANTISNRRFIGEGHFAVDYTPISVGDHQVEVKMGDVQVQGSPFVIKAFDVSKVNVTNVANGFVGKPGKLFIYTHSFTISSV